MTTNTMLLPSVRKVTRTLVQGILKDRLGRGQQYSPESLQGAARCAARKAATLHLWNLLQEQGLVKTELIPDEGATFDDVAGDTFDEGHADTIPGGLRALRAQRKREEERIEAGGVSAMLGFYRLNRDSGKWTRTTAVGLLLEGDEDEVSHDVMAETIGKLRSALLRRGGKCPRCGRNWGGAA